MRQNPKKRKLGPNTINAKGLGTLSTLLDQACKDEHIASNVAQGQQLPGATRLFHDLDQYRERYTKNWSRWWGRWLTGLKMTDPALTFHSFRHNFTAELRRLKCNVSIMKELLGHAQSDVTSGYGRTEGFLHELGDLNEEIQRIEYRGLDLGHLVELRPWSPT